jgi:hypothetical protein
MDGLENRSGEQIAERSYERIEHGDLDRLAEIATSDREEFFRSFPRWARLYPNRVIAVALCQGAALHYVDCRNGVKDFDVWTFFEKHPEAPFPHRRHGCRDFEPSKFGRHPEAPAPRGRTVDLFGRSIPANPSGDVIAAVQAYLKRRSTESARRLAGKAVVLLEPARFRGVVIWPRGMA